MNLTNFTFDEKQNETLPHNTTKENINQGSTTILSPMSGSQNYTTHDYE